MDTRGSFDDHLAMLPRSSPFGVVIVATLGFACAPEPAPTPAKGEAAAAGERGGSASAGEGSAGHAALGSTAKGAGGEPGGACEYVEHRSSCNLESVTFATSPTAGELTAIAAYTSPDPAAPHPLELRSRVVESQREAFEAHLRKYATIPCRWSTLALGSCGTPPPELVVPPFAP